MPLQTGPGKYGTLKNGFLSIAGVDLSSFVRSYSLKRGSSTVPLTAMGDNSDVSENAIKNWTLEVNFYQSYYTAEVDATIDPLVGGAAQAIIIRPDSTGPSDPFVPQWTGNANITAYGPVDGEHGAELMTQVSMTGTGDLTRAFA